MLRYLTVAVETGRCIEISLYVWILHVYVDTNILYKCHMLQSKWIYLA